MARLKLLLALLALGVVCGCAAQVERREASKPPEEQQEKAPFPTIIYRPGAGLTITGGS